jgi:integrase
MASFRQRNNKWQARISRQGFPAEVRTFDTKADAQRWAREVERAMDVGSFASASKANDKTLYDLIERYVDEVTPTKKGAKREAEGLRFILRHKIAQHSVNKLTPEAIARYRDERLRTVAAGTIIRELSILSSVISHARREWGVTVDNPCAMVRKPPAPQGRARVLDAEEESRLLHELRPIGRRSRWMQPIVLLALQTAMRRGELLSLRWTDVDLERRTATLHTTKNGERRIVPLSTQAVTTLSVVDRDASGFVFPITEMGLEAAFRKACARAEVRDLRFHDLRHTATSRLAEKLPNVIELAALTGHRTIQMLKRYYHPNPEVLARKLG